MTLPRKISSQDPAVRDARDYYGGMKTARVHPLCCQLWESRKRSGRQDTFIGLVNTSNWEFYIAPCFAVSLKETTRLEPIEAVREEMVSRGKLPDDVRLICSSTSAAELNVKETTVKELNTIYGSGNYCIVELPPFYYSSASFDGKSQAAFHKMICANPAFESSSGWFASALGFAIQNDSVGYYLRYASSLNQFQAQVPGIGRETFTPRLRESKNKEDRDLPKQWALFVESICARDLKLGILTTGRKFDTMTSREESKTTKLTRFVDTDNRLT